VRPWEPGMGTIGTLWGAQIGGPTVSGALVAIPEPAASYVVGCPSLLTLPVTYPREVGELLERLGQHECTATARNPLQRTRARKRKERR
jgi:hypothetical protein